MGARENRATIEGAYAAFAQGDVPAVIGINAPDAVWVNYSSPDSPLSGEHKGVDEIGAFFGVIGETIDIAEFDMAVVAADGDVVVARGHQTYTVKKTGKTVSGPVLHLFTFAPDGKLARFEEYETNVNDAWR